MGLQAIAHETTVSLSGIPRSVRQGRSLGRGLARTAAAATFLLALLVGFAHAGSRDDIEFGVPAVEAERIRHQQALEQERDRADRLARELAGVRAELSVAQRDREHAIGAIELGIRQTHALELERDKVSNLTRDLSFLKAELDAARIVASRAMQIPAADPKQEPIIEPGARKESTAAELASLRSDLDVARSAATEATTALAAEVAQQQALEVELKQQRDRSEGAVTELTSLRAELEAARKATSDSSKAAAAEATQKQAMEQELKLQRDRADAAANELVTLRAAANTARAESSDVAKAAAAKSDRALAAENELAQQRDRADAASKQLGSIRAEFDAARAASVKASAAEAEQRQMLERELGQQRDRADTLARETKSLTSERDDARYAAREATQAADAALAANKKELVKERAKSEGLLRELASARKEVEERSAGLVVAYAEILRVTELSAMTAKQNDALAAERERADALARELASTKAKLEQTNGKRPSTNASGSRPPEQTEKGRVADLVSSTEARGRSLEQEAARTVASSPQRPPESTRSTSQAQATDRIPPTDPKVAAVPERTAPTAAPPRSPADEQKLLARANALLRQSDISSARQLLELALARGSARAAFMLAETYDPPVLESWRARGVTGDPARARDLYQRAKAGGIDDADERIKALR
jgi:chromosome segregation ATPase